jgi:hypothetical protein
VSVAVLSGSSRARDRKLFSVLPVEPRRFRLFTPNAVNVCLGMEVSQRMTSPLWMRMANQSLLVSGVAVILIA